jgi:hypothetical protein
LRPVLAAGHRSALLPPSSRFAAVPLAIGLAATGWMASSPGPAGHQGALVARGLGSAPLASGRTPPASVLLRRSRAVLDGTRTARFSLTSAKVPSSAGVVLLGGQGDLVRPSDLRGSLLVTDSGASVTIKVVSAKGRFYVQLPFSTSYSATNPASYGLGNLTKLLSPTDGVSGLLTSLSHPRLGSPIRLHGELLDPVSGTVPGSKVPVLPDKNAAKPVKVTADIAPGTYQLRRVQLSGPFVTAGATTTYDLTITRYGEHLTITAPPT